MGVHNQMFKAALLHLRKHFPGQVFRAQAYNACDAKRLMFLHSKRSSASPRKRVGKICAGCGTGIGRVRCVFPLTFLQTWNAGDKAAIWSNMWSTASSSVDRVPLQASEATQGFTHHCWEAPAPDHQSPPCHQSSSDQTRVHQEPPLQDHQLLPDFCQFHAAMAPLLLELRLVRSTVQNGFESDAQHETWTLTVQM